MRMGKYGVVRVVEVLLTITLAISMIILMAYVSPLPESRLYSSPPLKNLGMSILRVLDERGYLSYFVYEERWDLLEKELNLLIPPNIAYNLTVYMYSKEALESPPAGVTKAENLILTVRGSASNYEKPPRRWAETVTYYLSPKNISFKVLPEPINMTCYIIACDDAPGWWITGYTPSTMAQSLYQYLEPYFTRVVIVTSTDMLYQELFNPRPKNVTIVNCHGEVIPIPRQYVSGAPPSGSPQWIKYLRHIREGIIQDGWIWISIVGYPFYYVSNRAYTSWKAWGVTGLYHIGCRGLSTIIRDNPNDGTWRCKDVGLVYLTDKGFETMNTYGIQIPPYQSSSRALSRSWVEAGGWNVAIQIFYEEQGYLPVSVLTKGEGAFIQVGLTRTPDIRVSVIALLSYLRPSLSELLENAIVGLRVLVLKMAYIGGG